MSEWPTVSIVLLTYARTDYAKKTLDSVLTNLQYSGQILVHVADDGSEDEHVSQLLDLAEQHGFAPTWSTSQRRGYGANYNMATQVVHSTSQIVLPLEDDWELVKPLDLDPIAKGLTVFGCIRMGYIGYTQELRGTFRYVEGLNYIELDPESEEPHVFAGHPRLESVWWEREVGPWPEGMEPGATEFAVAHRPNARLGVAWPVDLIHPRGDLFAHIGAVRSY